MSWVEKGNALHWEIWTRMVMDLVSSPFSTTRIFYWDMEVITGDRKRSSNPFFWEVVIQNSPGITFNDPNMPSLYRRESI